MGWNSWNHFQANVDETIVRAMADAMATNGMKDAGYRYINIDDCWQGPRDSGGVIHEDPVKFPSGIKALATYVHSKGLKLGIYSDVGPETCGGRPGSLGHELQDAQTYAHWGVDYLKYDWCNHDGLDARQVYGIMHSALAATGRPIVFSLCEWGQNQPWLWAAGVGQLWRTTTDIFPGFDSVLDHTNWQQWGVLHILDAQKGLRRYAGPGHWNDPDMLEVGNGMSESEDRAHFSMWCMLSAPLISGNNLADMAPGTLKILTNRSVIALDQDPLGMEGYPYATNNAVEYWLKPLAHGNWAWCALNRGSSPQKIHVSWQSQKCKDPVFGGDPSFNQHVFKLKNLWSQISLGTTRETLDIDVPGHDVVMLRMAPTPWIFHFGF